jgi:ribosomal-protein-alanine N-acetyltransferase
MSIIYDLKTDRLLLRPLQVADAPVLWPHLTNKEISKNMSWDAHKDISETIAFIERVKEEFEKGKSVTWGIFTNGIFCGVFSIISILRSHRSLVYDRAELAYWLAPEFQGQGIMTEAGQKIIDFAFQELKLHKIVVGHHMENKASEKLIKRLGFEFRYDEIEAFKKNGKWVDCKFYELRKIK